MTYNVFGGTLNPAQSNPMHWSVEQKRVNVYICTLHQHKPADLCSIQTQSRCLWVSGPMWCKYWEQLCFLRPGPQRHWLWWCFYSSRELCTK